MSLKMTMIIWTRIVMPCTKTMIGMMRKCVVSLTRLHWIAGLVGQAPRTYSFEAKFTVTNDV